MDHPTVAVIVRVYGPSGVGVAKAPVVAQLSQDVRFQGFTIPSTVTGETDDYGICIMRLWPNVLGDVPSEYKFTITNPESGKRKIVYAQIPAHDVFLDEISSANSGDWVDGGIGNPSGGSNNTATAGTVTAGTTATGQPGTLAQVINRGDAQNRILDFVIPAGRDGLPGTNGLNGTGTIEAGQTITGAPGTPALVRNVGTADRAVLEFTIPQGIPGTSTGTGGTGGSALPAGGSDKQVLVKVGSTDGTATWQTLAPIVDTLMGTYVWETGITPPPDLSTTTLDSITLAAYQAAIAGAALGSRRAAAANAIIVAMGGAQKLTLKRNGIAVLTADYTGPMVQTSALGNIGVTLPSTFTVGAISAADVSTGTWTGEITGGDAFARKITLAISPDVSTASGQGFNPTVTLIIPRSVDGL